MEILLGHSSSLYSVSKPNYPSPSINADSIKMSPLLLSNDIHPNKLDIPGNNQYYEKMRIFFNEKSSGKLRRLFGYTYIFSIKIITSKDNLALNAEEIKQLLKPILKSIEINFQSFKLNGIAYCKSNPSVIIRNLHEFLQRYIFGDRLSMHSLIKDTFLSGIKKMGFLNTKQSQRGEESIFLYAINDNGNNCSKQWATFPVLVTIGTTICEFQIIFAVDSRPGIFTGNKLVQIRNFISRANQHIIKGCFQYIHKKNQVVFKITQVILHPYYENLEIPQNITSEAIHVYTAFGYALYQIYSSPELSTRKEIVESNRILLEECIGRSRKPVEIFSLSGTKEIKTKRVKIVVESKDYEEEEFIMDCLKKNPLLERVFMVGKIIKDKEGYLYPAIGAGATVLELISTNKLAPRFYEQLTKVINTLIDCGLKIDGENLLKNLLVAENEFIWNYITPLRRNLQILPQYEIEDYSENIFNYLSNYIFLNI